MREVPNLHWDCVETMTKPTDTGSVPDSETYIGCDDDCDDDGYI